MAELSQFLNSGKMLKVVSAGTTSTTDESATTITPAAGQYVRFWLLASSNGQLATMSIGATSVIPTYTDISLFGRDGFTKAQADWIGGKGESVTVTAGPSYTITIPYQLLEEA